MFSLLLKKKWYVFIPQRELKIEHQDDINFIDIMEHTTQGEHFIRHKTRKLSKSV